MTTASWVSTIDHTSDAGFRTWGSELKTKLLAIGLVASSDTGQINWTTVTKPSTNTAAGYEIYYLNDTLHGSADLYLKFEYGTGSSSTVPGIWLTVGTGSNGSGTLTGQTSTRTLITSGYAPASTSVSYTSYACASEGQANLLFKASSGSSSFPMATFSLERTCDNSGNMTTTGYRIMYLAGTSTYTMQCVRTAAPAVSYTASTKFGGVVSNGVTASDDGAGNKQIYLHSGIEPVCRTLHSSICVIVAEFPLGTTFSVTIPGFSSPRTFISWANNVPGDCLVPSTSTTYASAKLWE